MNIRGELVGINTAIATRSGGNQGIGFAIPINMAQRIMEDLIEHGKVVRGWLGVWIQDITDDMARVLKLPDRQGTLVSQVAEDGPAGQAGVEQGDVIVELDGVPVEDTDDLRNRVATIPPGNDAKLVVLREGKQRTLVVTMGQLPAEYGGGQPQRPASRLGLGVQRLTPELVEKFAYKGKDGVLVSSVEPDSPADEAELREGDIIREINRETVNDVETYERLIREAGPGDTLLLLVRRTSGQLYLTLRGARGRLASGAPGTDNEASHRDRSGHPPPGDDRRRPLAFPARAHRRAARARGLGLRRYARGGHLPLPAATGPRACRDRSSGRQSRGRGPLRGQPPGAQRSARSRDRLRGG